MTRVALWAGRPGPGRASAGALVDSEGAPPEMVRRAVLACGIAMAADRLAATPPDRRDAVIRAFADARPDDLVDLTGPCRIGGLDVTGPGGAPPLDAAMADLVIEPGEDPDDADPHVMAGGVPPEEAAALAAAAMARALPRDPLHLARVGAALRSLAREATLYPDTLVGMAAGIAATSREPDAVRMFSDTAIDREPQEQRRELKLPEGRSAMIAVVVSTLGACLGVAIALLLLWLLDPGGATANRTTALVAGAVVGGAVGVGMSLKLLSHTTRTTRHTR